MIIIFVVFFCLQFNLVLAGNEIWPLDRPDGMPTINSLEVMCGKDHMDVHLSFSAPFDGIVSSKGTITICETKLFHVDFQFCEKKIDRTVDRIFFSQMEFT